MEKDDKIWKRRCQIPDTDSDFKHIAFDSSGYRVF